MTCAACTLAAVAQAKGTCSAVIHALDEHIDRLTDRLIAAGVDRIPARPPTKETPHP